MLQALKGDLFILFKAFSQDSRRKQNTSSSWDPAGVTLDSFDMTKTFSGTPEGAWKSSWFYEFFKPEWRVLI